MIPKFRVNPPGGNELSLINSNFRDDLRLEVVGCRTGESAANLGVPDVHDLEGGFEAWASAGLPVEIT